MACTNSKVLINSHFRIGLLKTREGPGDLCSAKQVSLRTGTADEEDRFGKAAASSNSYKLGGRSIEKQLKKEGEKLVKQPTALPR
jgi:hypothetical protein